MDVNHNQAVEQAGTEMNEQTVSTVSLTKALANKKIFLTGSTGFVGQVFLESLLRNFPSTHVYLLVRAKDTDLAWNRLSSEVLSSRLFSGLKDDFGSDYHQQISQRVTCVVGDLTKPRYGLDEIAFAHLASEIDVVVGSAASVRFDEALDKAIATNIYGAINTMQLAMAAKCPMVHVSTAYVSGIGDGEVFEQIMPFKDKAKPLAENRRPFEGFVESETVEDELRLLETMAAQANELKFKDDVEREEYQREIAVRHARRRGWADIYSFTKYLAEQLVLGRKSDIPLSIVRPTIIESPAKGPRPGWLNTLKVADPIFASFARAEISGFPCNKKATIDLIPVDMVSNAMIAVTATADHKEELRLFQVGSSFANGITMQRLGEIVSDYFTNNPLIREDGERVIVKKMRFPRQEGVEKKVSTLVSLVSPLSEFFEHHTWARAVVPYVAKLQKTSKQLKRLQKFIKLYRFYATISPLYHSDNTEALRQQLCKEDQEKFNFDIVGLDWQRYLCDVHLPGVTQVIVDRGGYVLEAPEKTTKA